MSWNDAAKITCQFKFKCPRVWHLLEPTAQDDVRHCAACDRDVYLAPTEESLRQHSEQGHCVAVPVQPPAACETTDGKRYSRMVLGMPPPSLFQLRRGPRVARARQSKETNR